MMEIQLFHEPRSEANERRETVGIRYPLIECFTSPKVCGLRGFDASETVRYEEFVRQLDLHFYEHRGVLWRIQ